MRDLKSNIKSDIEKKSLEKAKMKISNLVTTSSVYTTWPNYVWPHLSATCDWLFIWVMTCSAHTRVHRGFMLTHGGPKK